MCLSVCLSLHLSVHTQDMIQRWLLHSTLTLRTMLRLSCLTAGLNLFYNKNFCTCNFKLAELFVARFLEQYNRNRLKLRDIYVYPSTSFTKKDVYVSSLLYVQKLFNIAVLRMEVLWKKKHTLWFISLFMLPQILKCKCY